MSRIEERAKSLPQQQSYLFTIICRGPIRKIELRKKTGMDSGQIDKILRELASLNLIKALKTPQSKQQNVWVRYDTVVEETRKVNTQLLDVIKGMEGSVEDIRKDLIRKNYDVQDFDVLLQVLVNRGDLYLQGDRIWPRKLTTTGVLCLDCPNFAICEVGGPVSPEGCVYFEQW